MSLNIHLKKKVLVPHRGGNDYVRTTRDNPQKYEKKKKKIISYLEEMLNVSKRYIPQINEIKTNWTKKTEPNEAQFYFPYVCISAHNTSCQLMDTD